MIPNYFIDTYRVNLARIILGKILWAVDKREIP
jgi:hypothetical protein